MTMKKLKMLLTICAAFATFFSFSGIVSADGFQEYPIGDEKEAVNEHFKVALVYFQPIQMEPAGMMLDPDKSDIHMETDIHATEGNNTGFGVGEWIPYLTVHYKMTKKETGQTLEGVFMPMNADDGPHYGANIKMLGAGTYDCEFTFESPQRMNYGLHVDKETGVEGRFWEKPVVMHWTFNYVPRHW
ncbi:hypothetical protein SAMN04490178_102140 [Propionispora vibrioides]|uniref:Iron transporter n=2 Tax=Propionispora vibrioides TaxID=112903 RepID=A0A1H8Q194_9FIRM|nr:hypothetical protein SAMN04490178_102140 [Propionispora vibrioides]